MPATRTRAHVALDGSARERQVAEVVFDRSIEAIA